MRQLNSILVIDDNPIDNEIAQRIFKRKRLSKRVFSASDGREAISLLNKQRTGDETFLCPELILLDLNMPVMDGFEFLEQYKELAKRPKFSSSVVMILSSSENEKDKERVKRYPFVKDFIVKPLITERARRIVDSMHPKKEL